jgi:hypothetical protein
VGKTQRHEEIEMGRLKERLAAKGSKRILALDGGGIRGCLSLGILKRIEDVVRKRLDDDDARLSDYFDLIGGTSTGSIIAAALALGWRVDDLTERYLTLGSVVFSERPGLAARLPVLKKLVTAWDEGPLVEQLQGLFGEELQIGSPEFLTGLCIVAKRADTFSTWPLINHPDGKYYKYNAPIPVWRALRASSAAPTYFRPIEVDVGAPGEPEKAAFIDGGVSMANNPALQLFLVATLEGFPFHWTPGEDRMMLVSVGTGRWSRKMPLDKVLGANNLDWAASVPDFLMFDASDQNELLLQYLSNSPTSREIDGEVGDLAKDVLTPAMTYLRYNGVLEQEALEASLGEAVSEEQLASLRDMAAAENAGKLYEIGLAAADDPETGVREEHFPAKLDPRRA